MASLVDRAALALAAHDIRILLDQGCEGLLWSPGRPIWGVALVPETTSTGRPLALVAIDGCLEIAHLVWPGHFIPHGAYELDALARILGDLMRLARSGGQGTGKRWFRCALPQATSGDCCVLVGQEDLPWLAQERSESEGEGTPIWTAPGEPAASAQLVPMHSWLSLAGMRPALPHPGAFYAAVGEPPEMLGLPRRIRVDRLVSHWRQHLIHECARLQRSRQDLPSWLREDLHIERLARAWVEDGWRGPEEPPVAGASVAPAGASW